MNTLQTDNILTKILGIQFKGVYSYDSVFPISKKFPYGFVINTDPYGKPGKHWQAIWVPNKNTAEFFDSFGDKPKKNVENFLKKFKNTKKNSKKLQDNYESSCGPYVLYFLIRRSLGVTNENIINSLANRRYNDAFVKLFVYNILNYI